MVWQDLKAIEDEPIACLRKMLQEFKTKAVVLFKNHSESELFKMNFLLLAFLCETLSMFYNISFLHADLDKHLHVFGRDQTEFFSEEGNQN